MVRHAVGQDADEAEGPEVLGHRVVGEPGHRREREGDLDSPARRRGQDVVGRALRRVAANRGAADAAEAPADAGPEQAEVVVHLGGGADGRAAADGGIALLDGHRRGDALEVIHQRLGHPLEELLGVGGERLDVPPLPFGVERVEGQGALPGARRAGDDGQCPVGDLDRDSLQVVLPGVDDADDGHRGKNKGFGKSSGGRDGRTERRKDGRTEGRKARVIPSAARTSPGVSTSTLPDPSLRSG